MMKRFLFGCLLLLGAGAARADVKEGDRLFGARTLSTGAAEALSVYEKSFDGPEAVEARWKAARALHWLGDHAEKKKEKNAYFERGIELAKGVVEKKPDSADARFWLAALYGSYGESRGVMKSLALLGPIKEQLNALNGIDERYQGGAGHRVLGIVDYKVPAIAGGSRKRALERLNKALAIDGNNPFNHYYMAELMLEMGKKDEARRHLDALAACGVSADVDGPDLMSIQAKGAELRKKIR